MTMTSQPNEQGFVHHGQKRVGDRSGNLPPKVDRLKNKPPHHPSWTQLAPVTMQQSYRADQ